MKNDNLITALIVDDEPLARQYIRKLLGADAELEIVGEVGDGKSALELIRENAPDLIFLDIQMPEMNGFELLKNLGAENLPAIVFATAFEEYAIRAFEFHALDYLLKPFDAERFYKAVEFAKARLHDKTKTAQENLQIGEMLQASNAPSAYLERLLIKKNGRIVFLKVDEIDFIKSDDKYVEIYAGDTVHLVRQTLAAMKTQLNPQKFVQIHRSAMINIEKIKELEQTSISDYAVVMQTGAHLSVSRNFKCQLFEVLGKPI